MAGYQGLTQVRGTEQLREHVAGLMRVGAVDEAIAAATAGMNGGPSPRFGMSERNTSRRAPLGFKEEGTGANFFSLAAAVGATSTMVAKVSRVAHADRLLIVPSAPGVIIMSVKVGDVEQLLAAGSPVELYSEAALTDSVPDNFDPLGSGLDLIVVLQNTTAGAITGTIGAKCYVER